MKDPTPPERFSLRVGRLSLSAAGPRVGVAGLLLVAAVAVVAMVAVIVLQL